MLIILNKKLLLLFLLKPSSMKEISPRFGSTGSTKFKTVKVDKNVHTSSFSCMVYNQGFMDSDLGHFSRNCQFCNTTDNWYPITGRLGSLQNSHLASDPLRFAF